VRGGALLPSCGGLTQACRFLRGIGRALRLGPQHVETRARVLSVVATWCQRRAKSCVYVRARRADRACLLWALSLPLPCPALCSGPPTPRASVARPERRARARLFRGPVAPVHARHAERRRAVPPPSASHLQARAPRKLAPSRFDPDSWLTVSFFGAPSFAGMMRTDLPTISIPLSCPPVAVQCGNRPRSEPGGCPRKDAWEKVKPQAQPRPPALRAQGKGLARGPFPGPGHDSGLTASFSGLLRVPPSASAAKHTLSN
jgi:hypothetical protein